MPDKVQRKHFFDLDLVVTITEACELYGVDHKSVVDAIDVNNLAARKSGGIWLISTTPLMVFWDRSAPQRLQEM